MTNEQQTLFDVPPVRPKPERKKHQEPKYRGLYAAQPGTGPKDETCRTRKHKVYRDGYEKRYIKCDLVEKFWTKGLGSDILAGAPACFKWEKNFPIYTDIPF